MITSKKLTAERLREIKNFPITFDKDSPKLTAEQLSRMRPVHPEFWKIEPITVLREAMLHSKTG